MYFLTKNMGRNFAESKTLLNIALPSRCNYTASKEIRLPYGRILVSYLLCVVTAVWRLKGVRPLFIHTLTKFLSNTCQTATKICSRGTIVPELHHYPVSRRRSYSRSSKILRRKFAKSETMCIFVMPNVLNKVHKTYSSRYLAEFLRLFQSLVQCVWRRKGAPLLLSYTLINFCFSLCQTQTKVLTLRRIVRAAHSYPHALPRRSCSRSFTEIPFMNLSATTSSIVVPLPPCPDGACASAMAGSGRPRRTVSRTGSTPCVAFT